MPAIDFLYYHGFPLISLITLPPPPPIPPENECYVLVVCQLKGQLYEGIRTKALGLGKVATVFLESQHAEIQIVDKPEKKEAEDKSTDNCC